MRGQWQVLILRDKMDVITAKGIKIRVTIKLPWPTWVYSDFSGKIDGDLTRALFDLYNKKLRAGKLHQYCNENITQFLGLNWDIDPEFID